MFTFASAAELPPGFWQWPHISPTEWACKTDGSMLVVPEFMATVEKLRAMYGKPMKFGSCYRSPQHNEEVSATRSTDGAHTLGVAIDVEVAGEDALNLIALALGLGFTGIGVQQKGPIESRFVHLDMAPPRDNAPRPWLWTY